MKTLRQMLTEISKKTLGSYIQSASIDKSHHAHEIGRVNQASFERGATKSEMRDRDYHNEKHGRRSAGIGRAIQKLTK